jgi:hypothetical protein
LANSKKYIGLYSKGGAWRGEFKKEFTITMEREIENFIQHQSLRTGRFERKINK